MDISVLGNRAFWILHGVWALIWIGGHLCATCWLCLIESYSGGCIVARQKCSGFLWETIDSISIQILDFINVHTISREVRTMYLKRSLVYVL